MEQHKQIDYIIEKYGKAQNCIYFKLIEPNYSSDQIEKIKNRLIIALLILISSIFFIQNNGIYAIAVGVLFLISYTILNYLLLRFERIDEISFHREYVEIVNPKYDSEVIRIQYDSINYILSTSGLDQLFMSKRPEPLISLQVTFQTFNERYFVEIECVPFYKLFDPNTHRHKLWVENVLKAIDENYTIKDVTRLNENII